MSEQLAVRISDTQYSYQGFRDFVLNQTAMILMNRNCLPSYAVNEPTSQRPAAEEQDEEENNGAIGMEDMMAMGFTDLLVAVNGQKRGTAGRFQRKPAP